MKLPNHEHNVIFVQTFNDFPFFCSRHNPFICSIVILSSDEAVPAALQEKKMPPLPDCIRFVAGLSFLERFTCAGIFGTDVKKLKETRNVQGLILALKNKDPTYNTMRQRHLAIWGTTGLSNLWQLHSEKRRI